MIAAIVVVGLVSYRTWRLLAVDDLFERWRPTSKFLACPWCSGFWITGLVTLVAWQAGLTQDPLWVWPAASVVVGVVGDHT